MRFDLAAVSGIGEYKMVIEEGAEVYTVVKEGEEGKAFLVVWPKTIEVRCDENLSRLLMEKYESVMKSRYFGRGGIEIVVSGQLEADEIYDLVRLSYNLTSEKA